MTTNSPSPSQRAAAFKAWMARNNTNTKRVAKQADVPYTTLASFVQGHTTSLKGETEGKIAAALGRTVAEMFEGGPEIHFNTAPAIAPHGFEEAPPQELEGYLGKWTHWTSTPRLRPVQRFIPIVGEVAAGVWKETLPVELEHVEDWLPADVPGYERAALFALRVVGPSMNAIYPQGRYVIVAPAHEAGVRYGDHVIVERARGDLVETTIKELVNENGRIALWPRSHDPNFQQPIYLKDDDQASPRIIGIVIGDYARRERPAA